MRKLFVIIILIICIIFLNIATKNSVSFYNDKYNIFVSRLPLENFFVFDSVGFILGLRKFISDIAWIQLLQYYGGPPPEEPYHKEDLYEHMTKIQPGKYKKFIDYCKRVTILDPLYGFVYFYGVGALAWNLERPDEALKLVEFGLNNLEFQKNTPDSDYWELVKYQQAISYKLGGKYLEMVDKLKEIVDGGKAPNMVKAILANMYKKYSKYNQALLIWEELLLSGDPEYVERAKIQIVQIKNLMRTKYE